MIDRLADNNLEALGHARTQRNLAELRELLGAQRAAALSGIRAYRLLSLLGWFEQQHVTARMTSDEMADVFAVIGREFGGSAVLARQLAEHCTLPAAEALFDELADELEADEEDAISALQPLLLAIADGMTVRELLGRPDEASALGRHAAALIDLHPERMADLAARAELEIAAWAPDSLGAALWHQVLLAPGRTAVLGLDAPVAPARASVAYVHLARQSIRPRDVMNDRTGRVTGVAWILPARVPLPALPYAAAATVDLLDLPLHVEGQRVGSVFTTAADNRLRVSLRIGKSVEPRLRVSLVLIERASSQERGRHVLHAQRSGAELIVTLGEQVGPKSERHRLHQAVAGDLRDEELLFEIMVERED